MSRNYFQQLEKFGVTEGTLVEMGVLSDIFEDILSRNPHDDGLHIFAQMLGHLFQDEAKMVDYKMDRNARFGSLSSINMNDRFYGDYGNYGNYGRSPHIDVLRKKARKADYGLGFKDKPTKAKPVVYPVDVIYTEDDQVLYTLTNPDGMVDEYAKFTNLEKYVTSQNGKIDWLGDEEKRPMSLLWNEEDDVE